MVQGIIKKVFEIARKTRACPKQACGFGRKTIGGIEMYRKKDKKRKS